MNKTKIILGGVVIAAVFFYGGYAFASNSSSAAQSARGNRTFAMAAGGQAFARGMGQRNGGNFIAGSIIAKDSQSITIALPSGGSKIIFVSGSTQVSKMAAGSLDDLAVGTNVVVTGTANSDGSVTGQSIQVRPARTGTSTPYFMGGPVQQ
ncbi:MAG TPA: hypothetical protein VFT82_02065 [Candidatus Paceibacterota bacterium]|nr:hypothetical protein [Candidatus Paceibacterota bacterium]